MRKIRELLRLQEECGLTNRQIARALHISRPVVGEYLTHLKGIGITYAETARMSDDELIRVFEAGNKKESKRYKALSERFQYVAKELKRKGVTLHLLWHRVQTRAPRRIRLF